MLVHPRPFRCLRMHDEHADHPHHFLHRHMRVVEEGSFLVQGELIDETAARWNRVLGEARNAVHLDGKLEAVPVHAGHLRQVIVHDDPHPVPLDPGANPQAAHRRASRPRPVSPALGWTTQILLP